MTEWGNGNWRLTVSPGYSLFSETDFPVLSISVEPPSEREGGEGERGERGGKRGGERGKQRKREGEKASHMMVT